MSERCCGAIAALRFVPAANPEMRIAVGEVPMLK
jgi:hypothetical protein